MELIGALHNAGDDEKIQEGKDFEENLEIGQHLNEAVFSEAMEWNGEWHEAQAGREHESLPGVDSGHVKTAMIKELKRHESL